MGVAVVIVTRNDPRIDACLRSVFEQAPPFPFDVLVVDNGSEPSFGAGLDERWGTRPNFRRVSIPGNFSGAWNKGAFSTTADILVRLDSDTIAHPAWLERMVTPLRERPSLTWTAGPVVGPDPLRSLTQRYFHHRTLGYQRRLEGEILPTDAVPSWNVAYRREALERVGGYDAWQRSSIDWDLHKRLTLAGYTGVFVPDATITHDHPRRVRDFYRKEAWYRTGQYQMMLKYGPGALLESLALPAVYLFLACLGALALLDARLGYVAAVFAGFLVLKQWLTARMEKDAVWWARPLFRLVEAFAALHGLIRGVATFGIRRRHVPGGLA